MAEVKLPKNYREATKLAKDTGFNFDRKSGSHETWKNSDGKICIISCHGNKDIPKGTGRSILKMLGLLLLPIILIIISNPMLAWELYHAILG